MAPFFHASPSLRHGCKILRRSRSSVLLCRHVGSAAADATAQGIDLSNPTYIVWGSNTGVGKTIVSAGIAASVVSPSSPKPSTFLYLKPVQTGFPCDSDARFVCRKVSALFRRLHGGSPTGFLASNRVLHASKAAASELLGGRPEQLGEAEERDLASSGVCVYGDTRFGKEEMEEGDFRLVCKTLFGWKEAISPHLAVEREGMPVEDSSLRELLGMSLGVSLRERADRRKEEIWRVIETAGGVASPGPSGTLQCDLYRPLRLPAILVGDGHLGGISGTIAAYECLTLRGYDVVAIILEDHGLSNEVAIQSYLRSR